LAPTTSAQEDCARLTLVRFSSVGHGPTSATEPSMQLDLESETICRRTSDNRWRHEYVISGTKAWCESFESGTNQEFCL